MKILALFQIYCVMDNEKHTAIALYQHLGKLFYAIVFADKKMKKEEINVIKKEISSLSNSENLITTTEIDIEHYITSTFNLLYIENKDAQTCFTDFITFKKKHEILFTPSLKNAILEISGKIARSFSNLNKSELMMLAKLSIELKKITS